MALPLRKEDAFATADSEQGSKIVNFTVVRERQEAAHSPEVLASFEAIMLPHLDAAHSLARWLVRNQEDAQDVVQEAYLRAFRSFGGFRGGNGRAWLLTIVRNTVVHPAQEKGSGRSLHQF